MDWRLCKCWIASGGSRTITSGCFCLKSFNNGKGEKAQSASPKYKLYGELATMKQSLISNLHIFGELWTTSRNVKWKNPILQFIVSWKYQANLFGHKSYARKVNPHMIEYWGTDFNYLIMILAREMKFGCIKLGSIQKMWLSSQSSSCHTQLRN